MEEYLGIDVGGTNVKMAFVTAQGTLHAFESYPTADWRADGFVRSLVAAIRRKISEQPTVRRVGIGVPGTLTKDRRTTLELPAIPQLNGLGLLDELEAALPDRTFTMENDANAAALGELYFADETPGDDFLFFTLGTGVGGAAVIDRRLFGGGDGNGLELGHVVSRYGRRLEQNIGKHGMLRLAERHLAESEDNSPLAEGTLSSTRLIAAATDGDPLALRVFTEIGEIFGEALVGAVRLLDIKTIIIGGGLSVTLPFIEAGLRGRLEHYLTPYYLDALSLRRARLGNDAGLLGAGSLVFTQHHPTHTTP